VRKGESEVNHRDKIEKLLKNYKSYKCAMLQYEKHKPFPQAGVANYSGMPSGSGAPELFFAQVGKMADMGDVSNEDKKDYEAYSMAVEAVESALDTLEDDERSIIKQKWIDKLTLKQIASKKSMHISTVKAKHRSAFASLAICFRFIEPPQIEEIPKKGSVHMRYNETNSNRIQTHMDIN